MRSGRPAWRDGDARRRADRDARRGTGRDGRPGGDRDAWPRADRDAGPRPGGDARRRGAGDGGRRDPDSPLPELPRFQPPGPAEPGQDPVTGPLGRQADAPPETPRAVAADRDTDPAARPSITDTMAAELAGWAAGELPGQASARLAAWATVGGAVARGRQQARLGGGGTAAERIG